MNAKPAPIALFVFKKVKQLKRTLEALKINPLAKQSDLYIFSDAAKNTKDCSAVDLVRHYIKTVDGFNSVTIKEAGENKGLAASIIEGVTDILMNHETVIVLEDDLISSPNFLNYMNNALEYYSNYPNVFSIAGYSPPIKAPVTYPYDTYFTLRASSWGWATWKNRWMEIDWEVSSYAKFKRDLRARYRFNQMGSDMTGMLSRQMKGELDSWAIRWCYHQFRFNLYTVFPVVSKIQNVGFVEGATHTKSNNTNRRFSTPLDNKYEQKFSFAPEVNLNPILIKQFVAPYSLKTRIYFKLVELIGLKSN